MARWVVLGLAIGLITFSASAATTKPHDVTRADVAGKTLCWSRGSKETYKPDGSFLSSGDGKGTWEMLGGTTVSVKSDVTGDWAWNGKVLADGTISSAEGANTAHYCK